MKVSVITVAYNSATTISDTLKSVAMQSYSDVEHIVIDGASQDGTIDMLKRFDSGRMLWISEPDKGIYDAMNKGLKMAQGDIIGFLNADDVFASENAVEELVNKFRTESVLAAYGDLIYVAGRKNEKIIRYWRSGSYSAEQLPRGWMPPHPTFYVSKELAKIVVGFDASLRIAADYDFMLRCLMKANDRVGYIPQVLVRMRLGGVSNRSVSSIYCKMREDLQVIRRYSLWSFLTLFLKNLRKLGQLLTSRGK